MGSNIAQNEDINECVNYCRNGALMHRVQNAKLTSKRHIYLSDNDYLQYLSAPCLKLLPAKLKSVNIDDIVEVRSGFNTDNLMAAAKKYKFREKASEDLCLSVIFANYRHAHKSLDFVAENNRARDKFAKGLQHFVEKKSLQRRQFNEQCWLIKIFQRADTNHNGKLGFNEIWELLKQFNVGVSKEYALALFKDVIRNTSDLQLDDNEFVEFFNRLVERPDLSHILMMFSSASVPALTPTELHHFLSVEQEFTDVDEKKALSLINSYATVNEEKKLLEQKGFRHLLMAEWGSIIKHEHKTTFQDMDQSLSHYYVNSSHNTYLTGLQLAGEATVEGYINALRCGARLLELDVFDGEEGEPCITHKRTLIKAITLKDALKAINEYAFKNSPYPVVLTIENNVSLPQQKAMARIINEVLGDKLYKRPKNGAVKSLPSPNDLKYSFLLRGKKLREQTEPDRKLSQEIDNAEYEHNEKIHGTIELDPEYSLLISLPSVKISKNIYEDIEQHPLDGSASLSETKISSYFEGGFSLAAYTAKRFVKSYPKGIRQDSSNMDPVPSWLCGVQSVAMNMQTNDEYMDLVKGLFAINGNCGYVLKPGVLINGLDPRSPEISKKVMTTVIVGVISAQYLPRKMTDSGTIDPYVTVETYGIPADVKKFRTKMVQNNGFNPQFNETFTFQLHFPDFALLRFCVKDFDSTSANDFVGEFTAPVSSIRAGYSHVRLNTGFAHTVDECASLLVRIALDHIQ